jgi:protease-4
MIGRFLRALWRGITLLRLALANLLFIAFLALLWFAFRGGSPMPLPAQAALLLDPAGRVVDQRSAVEALAVLGGPNGPEGEVLLRDLIDAVDYAREDERISALVLDLDELLYIGQSKTLELAEAIARFRDSGKPVVAAGDYYSQDQYRLAVEADHVIMNPLGAVGLEGYGNYLNYFAGALEKLAINVHVFRSGDNKSLGEVFQRSDMSPGEKAVTLRWLQQLWGNYREDVEARRGLDRGSLDALINDYPARLAAADGDPGVLALEAGLVDELLGRGQRREYLAALVGARDKDGDYESVAYNDYLSRMRPVQLPSEATAVAVVTAQGNMVPGEQGPGTIGADSLAQLLQKTAQRPFVKAIVLRVNSGGGSVFAAEVIREQIARIRSEGTPVVVSMGAVAASGGYYIAAEADEIYATEATLTGSIGVIVVFPTFEGLLDRAGISTDGVGTTELAGTLRLDRPLAPELAGTLQLSVDSIYEDFVALVARGRGIPESEVRVLADGRVLSAADALDAGLIDGIGGLSAAVSAAAARAGLDSYRTIDMELPRSPQEQLLNRIGQLLGERVLGQLPAAGLLQWLMPVQSAGSVLQSFKDPRHLYMRCLECTGS